MVSLLSSTVSHKLKSNLLGTWQTRSILRCSHTATAHFACGKETTVTLSLRQWYVDMWEICSMIWSSHVHVIAGAVLHSRRSHLASLDTYATCPMHLHVLQPDVTTTLAKPDDLRLRRRTVLSHHHHHEPFVRVCFGVRTAAAAALNSPFHCCDRRPPPLPAMSPPRCRRRRRVTRRQLPARHVLRIGPLPPPPCPRRRVHSVLILRR